MKKIMSTTLILVLLCAMLSTFALPAAAATSGTVGNCTWTLDGTVLTISGEGSMGYASFAWGGSIPWGTSITEVKVESGVTEIAAYAFEDCTNLSKVTVADTVISIGRDAFKNTAFFNNAENWEGDVLYLGKCIIGTKTSLSGSYAIKEGTKSISYGAFQDCTGLTELTVPASLANIAAPSFAGCTNLKKVNVLDFGAWCRINFERNYLSAPYYSDYYSTPLNYGAELYVNDVLVTDVVIPEGTTIWGRALMGYSSLKSVSVPESVTSIDDYAFAKCSNLSSVEIPNSVAYIGDDAFSGCKNLSFVYLSSGVNEIGEGAFGGCSSLNEIIIPEGVTAIENYTFSGCSNLKSITIPSSVNYMGYSAFSNCNNLEKVFISDLAAWCQMGFYSKINYGCNPLTFAGELYLNNERVIDLVIPESVTKINSSVFEGFTGLNSIIIPGSVTQIESYAFMGCTGLTSITIPESVTDIGNDCFSDCTNVELISLPDSLQSIGVDSFENTAYYNNSANWDGDILYIGNHLIQAKETISGQVTVKSDTKTIAGGAFADCIELQSIIIPNGVTTIGLSAFWCCEKLSSIVIPNSVKTIDKQAFFNCYMLTDVYFVGTNDEWEQITIEESNEALLTATVHYHTEHQYVNNCDSACDICGATREITHTYANACDTTCDVCVAVRGIAHTYANACDTACDVCGATREIVHSFGEYVYNNDATMEADGTRTRACTVCGYSETVTAPGTLVVLSNPFTDVKAGVYYEKPVLWAVNKGITNGMGNGQFKPNETCTRGQIVTFLWRAQGCPEPQSAVNPFSDVAANAYYTKAVLWAVEQGITNGTGAGKFSPNAECTREQIVTFLWRSQGKPVMGSANPFSDVASGTYYHNAVLWAVDKGITKGTSATTFAPKDDCTRGQIVTFLYRCLA